MVSLYTDQVPAIPNEVEAGGITTGQTYLYTAAGQITHVRFFATTAVGGTYTGTVYEANSDDDPDPGTELASGSILAAVVTPGAWNIIPVSPPVTVEVGTKLYRPALHNTDGRYVATSGLLVNEIVNGPITSPAAGTDPAGLGSLRQGVYAVGAAPVYPKNSSGNASYFVDTVFAADAPPNEGAADFTLGLTVAATGDAPPVPPNQGAAAVGLGLALAAAGDAPDIPPSEGTADLPMAFTLSGTGETPAVGPGEGAAAFTIGLAVAAGGDAPPVPVAEGASAWGIAYALSGTGFTPAAGGASGSAAFTLGLAVAAAGDNGGGYPFPCSPVRSFSEVMTG